jgi:hypothetical protein
MSRIFRINDFLSNQFDLANLVASIVLRVEHAVVRILTRIIRKIVVVPTFMDFFAYHDNIFNLGKSILKGQIRALELQFIDSLVPVREVVHEEPELCDVANEAISE